jgi:hypothetical protein
MTFERMQLEQPLRHFGHREGLARLRVIEAATKKFGFARYSAAPSAIRRRQSWLRVHAFRANYL